jgi:glycosyltransferase involved in cell wall biosynthesis
MRLATFTFRSIPQRPGCAGVDKVSLELYTRLAARGHDIVAYNRLFPGEVPIGEEYRGIRTKNFYTITRRKGFDSFVHSCKACWDIVRHDTADLVHVHSTGNSPFALALRLCRKKVVLTQDGIDSQREKWPWYARLYLRMTVPVTALSPHRVVFDSIFYKADFERRYKRRFDHIAWGSEVALEDDDPDVLAELGLEPGEYFLFVGRFIPDKGLHYLIPAFERLNTRKKLVLIGGPPNPAAYEHQIMSTTDDRITFPGFIFGDRLFTVMRNAYAYVQPSDIEGMAPVVLENMGLGVPMITSDIPENQYAIGDTGLLFERGNIDDLEAKLQYALDHPDVMRANGDAGQRRAEKEFSWDRCADQYEQVFAELLDVVTDPS